MEYQKARNLPDTTSDNVPRFIAKKWIEVYDQSGSAEKRYKPTSTLQSDLCDFSRPYIALEGYINVAYPSSADRNVAAYDKKLVCIYFLHFKN